MDNGIERSEFSFGRFFLCESDVLGYIVIHSKQFLVRYYLNICLWLKVTNLIALGKMSGCEDTQRKLQ
jgi:hypothetical protein